jgi:hypothetical protein
MNFEQKCIKMLLISRFLSKITWQMAKEKYKQIGVHDTEAKTVHLKQKETFL